MEWVFKYLELLFDSFIIFFEQLDSVAINILIYINICQHNFNILPLHNYEWQQ